MKKRKLVTLEDGSTCQVRRVTQWDALEMGTLPDPLATGKATIGDRPAEIIKQGFQMIRIALLKCCGKITTPDGLHLKIVDKPFDECDELGEISVEELSNADATSIWLAVQEISGLKKETAQAVESFPEKQEAVGPAASTQ